MNDQLPPRPTLVCSKEEQSQNTNLQYTSPSHPATMAHSLHIVMYPWFALGHLTAFLRLANKLAQLSQKVSFFIPPSTQSKLKPLNLYPHLISFIPISVPAVEGLPVGAETTSDVPFPLRPIIMTAMDATEKDIELALQNLKPDFVLFDYTHWLPALARKHGIKSIHYCSMSSASVAYLLVPARQEENANPKTTKAKLMQQPEGFPSNSDVKVKSYEAQGLSWFEHGEFGTGVSLHKRSMISLLECDAIGFRTTRELEGPYCDYVGAQFGKPVLLSGPMIPEPPTLELDQRWAEWLGRFKPHSVVYCSFGSECMLQKDQFQELLLGMELTQMPFLVALKVPMGVETIEDALPEGFEERVKDTGVVFGGWMQQQLILKHPSVGCFLTHCGSGSLSEGMVNKCQLVLLPQMGDQFVNARVAGGDLKVGVEVERREEDGRFSKESVCKAVKMAMEEESEVGREIRANHDKWREFLLKEGLEASYVKTFVQKLQGMLK